MTKLNNREKSTRVVRDFVRFRSTIYGRVVFIITGSLIVVFVLFNILFRSVYMDFFNRTISQNGDNIGSIIEGSLYYSMLENDKAMLQRTMDVIGTMAGIDEVNLYNDRDQLVYSSVQREDDCHCNPNCISCHDDLGSRFSSSERSYLVVGDVPECGIHQHMPGIRHLLVRQPILNEPSCYAAACHAHEQSDKVLGSLLVSMPLDDLDTFSVESSTDFMLLALLIIVLIVTFLVVFTRKRIKDPLNSIIKASEAVSSGDNNIRLEIKPELLDDMRMVSLAFNNMLDNMDEATNELQNWSQQLEYKVQKKSEELSEAQNELIHVERIASLGKLSSSVAHEINNPLSGILVYNKLIQKQLNSAEFYHPKKESILEEPETDRIGDKAVRRYRKGIIGFLPKGQGGF